MTTRQNKSNTEQRANRNIRRLNKSEENDDDDDDEDDVAADDVLQILAFNIWHMRPGFGTDIEFINIK